MDQRPRALADHSVLCFRQGLLPAVASSLSRLEELEGQLLPPWPAEAAEAAEATEVAEAAEAHSRRAYLPCREDHVIIHS